MFGWSDSSLRSEISRIAVLGIPSSSVSRTIFFRATNSFVCLSCARYTFPRIHMSLNLLRHGRAFTISSLSQFVHFPILTQWFHRSHRFRQPLFVAVEWSQIHSRLTQISMRNGVCSSSTTPAHHNTVGTPGTPNRKEIASKCIL
jgi:hypothetical protein